MVEALNGFYTCHIDAQVGTGETVDAGFLVYLQTLIRDLDSPFRTTILAGLPPLAPAAWTKLRIDYRLVTGQSAVKVHLTTLACTAHPDVFNGPPIATGGMALKMGHREEGIRIR